MACQYQICWQLTGNTIYFWFHFQKKFERKMKKKTFFVKFVSKIKWIKRNEIFMFQARKNSFVLPDFPTKPPSFALS